jgi:hypothetical protein
VGEQALWFQPSPVFQAKKIFSKKVDKGAGAGMMRPTFEAVGKWFQVWKIAVRHKI